MKKILFIIYTHSLGGGAERIFSNVLNGLAAKTDYKISVLEYAKYGVKEEKIDSRIKILKPIVDMQKSSKVEKAIKYAMVHLCPQLLRSWYVKEKYDVEIAFNYQIPSFLLSSSKDVYKVQWNHGDVYDLKDNAFKRFLQNLSYKKADRIVAISNNTKRSILEVFGQHAKKLGIIYNGTDVDLIIKESDSPTDIKLKDNSLVFLGRIEPGKDPMRLVKYTERLINEGVEVNLYLLGVGVQQEELFDYIRSSGLDDRIFMLGYIKNPYPIIKQSAAICMLSKTEGFPTVFTEGMALGKPFISSEVGGVEELSNDGKCGVVVADYDEFKQAVLNVVVDSENNGRMSVACKEHIKMFSYDEQIKNTIGLIEQI